MLWYLDRIGIYPPFCLPQNQSCIPRRHLPLSEKCIQHRSFLCICINYTSRFPIKPTCFIGVIISLWFLFVNTFFKIVNQNLFTFFKLYIDKIAFLLYNTYQIHRYYIFYYMLPIEIYYQLLEFNKGGV